MALGVKRRMPQQASTKHLEVLDDSKAIPLDEVQRAFDTLSYGSSTRVMFGMLALTGCRMRELDRMRRSMVYGDVLHWFLGKRQRHVRKVRLPGWFWSELRYHWSLERPPLDRMFSISAETFRRYFNRDARPLLGGVWEERAVRYQGERVVYGFRYQLNGLRKNYQTLRFSSQWQRWRDAQVAVEFTSKEMKHKSTHITCHHYIENFESLGLRQGDSPPPLLEEAQSSLGPWL